MRTRIALVAVAPIAGLIITALLLAATAQSARADFTPSSGTTSTTIAQGPSHRDTPHQPSPAGKLTAARSSLLLDLNPVVLSQAAVRSMPSPPASAAAAPTAPSPSASATPPAASAAAPAAPAPAAPVDTVTPSERAAWERVALCEEGGDWSASSSRFSGGLGITRANWDNYGGRAFAPEGALATEDQQIMVAERIEPVAPDQGGCHGW